MTFGTDAFAAAASGWAAGEFGPRAVVREVVRMPGNSGLSFGFELDHPETGSRRLVARLAPPGVKVQGNADVLHQVPLLSLLARSGVPVPAVRYASGDHEWFPTDVLMVDYVDARPFHLWDRSLSVEADDEEVPALAVRAVEVLATIHAVSWEPELSSWSPALSATDAVSQWDGVLSRGVDASSVARATSVRDALLASTPPRCRIGLCHGDYQLNNVLFGSGRRVAAVVDWEIAGIGPTAVDLAWLAMWTDPACWAPEFASHLRAVVPAADLMRAYERASGRPVEDFAWHRALACYEYAVIGAYNLRLHRSGRKPDPYYERLAASLPVLQRRTLELLS